MIKIRYADLPGGLHARAEARGRHTVIIYLLPGLTVAQRRAALRRLRSSARVGHGPRLSAAGIARAMVADRIRTNVGNAAAALRVHPAILAPPLVLTVAAAVAFVLLVPMPVGINSAPSSDPGAVFRQPGPPVLPGGGLAPNPGQPHQPATTDHWRSSVKLTQVPPQNTARPAPAPTRSSARPKPRVTGTPAKTPSSSPSPSPTPSLSASSSASSPPAPLASPSPSPSGSGGSLCLSLAVLVTCL